MDFLREVNERYSVSLSRFDIGNIGALADSGYASVVDLRAPEESAQGQDSVRERDAVSKVGMTYAHIPVSSDRLDEAVVNEFRECISGLKGKVLVHAGNDERSVALTLMHLAAEKGLTGQEAVDKARQLGVAWANPDLAHFVEQYVDRNSADIHYV